MSTRTRLMVLTCTTCGDTADLPEDRDHRQLWAAGWRWIGTLELYSCPDCPQVVVVDQEGRHHRGPGAEPAPAGTAALPN